MLKIILGSDVLKTLLKITKYLFIVTLLSIIIVVCIFIYYSKKVSYEIPNRIDVKIYDRDENQILNLNNENKQSYSYINEVNINLINAIISIEDKKFYSHKGIDVIRIGGALSENIKESEIREGASTITQQYARLLYLSSEKKVKRKIEEILIAMNLETKYSKNEILEGYLNSIYFDHGIYGVKDAAKYYFNKNINEITLAEAAILAAIPKGPSYYSPIRNPDNNKKRKELILSELLKDEKISNDEYEFAIAEQVTLYGKIDKTNASNAPYYQDVIIKELKNLGIFLNKDIKSLKVHTSLDLNLTQIALKAYEKYQPYDEDIQMAIYAMDPNTGQVLSLIGGVDYEKSSFNRAVDALRQPGSIIKPFLYYAALNNGFTPITTFKSAQTDFYYEGKLYSPSNFADIYADKEVTMAYAIATSDNIYAVKTHLFLGTNTLVNTLSNFGFTTPIHNTASLALGTSEVKLSEITNAYGQMASLGKDLSPVYITKITDENNNVIYLNKQEYKQVHNKLNLQILSETLTNIFDNKLRINISATGAAISSMLSTKYAAKTGTTDFDSWIVGYNPDIVLGIWCGYDDNREISPTNARFIKYIWAEIMEKYNSDKPYSWYENNDNMVTIKVNPITGELAKAGEYEKELYFDINNIPYYIFEKKEEEIPKDETPFNPLFPDFLYPDDYFIDEKTE